MTALCVGRDPEWWSPEHEQARLAQLICGLCTGCPSNDDSPTGVIRQGQAYSDAGTKVPPCVGCGRPNVSYEAGWVAVYCPSCRVREVPIPVRADIRASRRNHAVALARRGFDDVTVAEESGLSTNFVKKLRQEAGLLRRQASPAGATA